MVGTTLPRGVLRCELTAVSLCHKKTVSVFHPDDKSPCDTSADTVFRENDDLQDVDGATPSAPTAPFDRSERYVWGKRIAVPEAAIK